MKKALKKEPNLYYIIDGVSIFGPNPKMRGNCSELSGNCSGLSGDCTRLSGNLDECDITEQDRIKSVEISTLVQGGE